MPTATLTSKGQITIPKPIRAVLEFEPGDRVAFRVDDEVGRVLGCDRTVTFDRALLGEGRFSSP